MHNEHDFWEELLLGQMNVHASSLDQHLAEREEKAQRSGLRVLTDVGREAAALPLPARAGTRVAFVTNLGSVLAYECPPDPRVRGTVVMVRTADGDVTSVGAMVFVKFDDGRFMAVNHEHLRRAQATKVATAFARRVAEIGDLGGFLQADDSSDLIHKATRDLWSFQQTDKGDYLITRLFKDTGEPLRV